MSGHTACKYVAHRECYEIGGHTCEEVRTAMKAKPLIFMAADEADRERWLSNLAAVRDTVQAGADDAAAPPSPTDKAASPASSLPSSTSSS